MDDGKLIELVRNWPCLYDKSHRDFKDRGKKRLAWLEVASNLEVDENTAIRRWGNLRERFSKEIRGCRNTSGSGACVGREWSLLESLQFLKPHIVPLPMRQSAPLLNSSLDINELSDIFCESQDSISPAQTVPVCPDSLSPVSSDDTATSTSRTKKRKAAQLDELDTTIMESIKTFQEVCARKARRDELSGEVRGFSTMICSMISKMSTSKQAEVMKRCIEIVMQAQIDEQNTNNS